MKAIIIFFMCLSCCYGQHPYFTLTQEQLMKESYQDGYRSLVQLIDNNVVYTLTNGWDTIRVVYSPISKLPSYIIYREDE